MKHRLVILTEIISPYRIPLFSAVAKNSKIDPHVIFLAETDPNLRQWRIYKEEMDFSYQILRSRRMRVGMYNVLLNCDVSKSLARAAPGVILCGGYNYIASWQALFWARKHNVPFVLWSESNAQDMRGGHALVEFLKTKFVQRCSGFVVPGRSALEYLRLHKVNEQTIFIAPNAVDNRFYAAAAEDARQNTSRNRAELGLPGRYFLFAGRLVREKGVFELLSAYAKLEESIRRQIGVVFVGDGAARAQLEQQARAISPGTIMFAGFAQRERLAVYYALAEMLILPTYTDPWGLVVNEAMVCGLPVILSQAAGCAADLLRENWNGLLVSPADVTSLTSAMRNLACRPELCETMGARSKQLISQYSPLLWATAIEHMIDALGESRD